jgi:hypothetical protein
MAAVVKIVFMAYVLDERAAGRAAGRKYFEKNMQTL